MAVMCLRYNQAASHEDFHVSDFRKGYPIERIATTLRSIFSNDKIRIVPMKRQAS